VTAHLSRGTCTFNACDCAPVHLKPECLGPVPLREPHGAHIALQGSSVSAPPSEISGMGRARTKGKRKPKGKR